MKTNQAVSRTKLSGSVYRNHADRECGFLCASFRAKRIMTPFVLL
jgi:hypothetical protein